MPALPTSARNTRALKACRWPRSVEEVTTEDNRFIIALVAFSSGAQYINASRRHPGDAHSIPGLSPPATAAVAAFF
eukprot:COSAG06_NODE_33919_length_482_cov_1.015666_2_plen_75_part_01